MKKNQNSYFKIILYTAIVVAVFLLSYVFFVLKIKSLNNIKREKFSVLNEKENLINIKLVEIQKLSSEERIVRLAKEKLGLVQESEPASKIVVDKKLINHINKILKNKYE